MQPNENITVVILWGNRLNYCDEFCNSAIITELSVRNLNKEQLLYYFKAEVLTEGHLKLVIEILEIYQNYARPFFVWRILTRYLLIPKSAHIYRHPCGVTKNSPQPLRVAYRLLHSRHECCPLLYEDTLAIAAHTGLMMSIIGKRDGRWGGVVKCLRGLRAEQLDLRGRTGETYHLWKRKKKKLFKCSVREIM